MKWQFAVLFVALTVELPAYAQVNVVPSDQPVSAPSSSDTTIQSDLGDCNFDASQSIVTIFPPKKIVVSEGKNCSVVCKFVSSNTTTEVGCDVSLDLQEDGSICRRKVKNDIYGQSLSLSGAANLICTSDIP